eukprot:scaffold22588_cov114-Cylindrotheca_fusiformis.AAC.4
MEIFMYLSVPELLRSVAFVCRRFWRMLLHDDIVWNRKLVVVLTTSRDPFQKTHQDATTLMRMRMNRHQIQRFCWHAEYQQQRNARPIMFGSTSDSLASPPRRRPLPDFLKDGQLLVRRRDATSLLHGGYYYYTPSSQKKSGTHRRSLPVRRYVCLASTTDHTHERIENVLNDSSIRTASPIRNNTNLRRPITEEEYWENTIRSNSVKNNHDQNNETTTTTRASLEFRNTTTTTTTAMLFSYSQQPWWSSVSREDPNSDETLIFSTRYPLCSISEIAIKPYTDWMETVYTWKHLGIQIYNLPVLSSTTSTTVMADEGSESENDEEEITLKHLLPSEIGNYGDTYEGGASDTTTTTAGRRLQATAAAAAPAATTTEGGGGMEQHPHFGNKTLLDYLARQTPVYEHYNNTPPTPKDNSWQYHKLPIGIIGNVVVFQLMGKNFRQFDNTGYYACVQSVEVRGIPLYESPQPTTNMATTTTTTELDDTTTTTTTANSFEMQRRETRRDIAIRRDLEIVPLFIQNS